MSIHFTPYLFLTFSFIAILEKAELYNRLPKYQVSRYLNSSA